MSSPSPPDQSAYPSRRPATTSGNGNPTASVVRFSSPVPPAVSPSRHNAPHHVVDVGTSDLGPRSALSYGHAYGVIVNPRSEAMLAPHKRIFRFVRRIVEEIWIDMIFFHLPKMYQTRVREVALHARKNAFIQSCHGRGSGSRVGLQEYSGDVETDLDDETDMDLDEMEVNGSGANLKHPTHQTKPRPGRGIRESHESVNVFTDANNDGMDLAEWNILIGDLLQEWKTVVFAAALMFS
ncbi:hypothetical protein VKT23_019269 [Stygiomarasmius scandens]|uniref:Uncharacterized protein n=1 Tax=Marasmiellus scandens TaxID=2682957 RepID=A0ABR1IP15_9AGAR